MCLKNWYYEDDGGKSNNFAIKGSAVEIFLFYVSLVLMTIFSLIVWCSEKFELRYLVLLLPFFVWVFLRSSRKDMNATGNWIAGLVGAMGGAILMFLSKKFLP